MSASTAPGQNNSPAGEGPRKTRLKLFLFVGLFLLAIAFGVYVASRWFSNQFLKIDQSRATLGADDSGLVYQNPTYGVTLRLPGIWLPDTGKSSHFCDLLGPQGVGPEGFVAGFWPVFSAPTQSLDDFVAALRDNLLAKGTYTLEGEEKLLVNGMPARELRLSAWGGEGTVLVIVVKRRLSAYVLAIFGPVVSRTAWQGIIDGLPSSIEVK
jgi:hypothetical protein